MTVEVFEITAYDKDSYIIYGVLIRPEEIIILQDGGYGPYSDKSYIVINGIDPIYTIHTLMELAGLLRLKFTILLSDELT